jgi:hypothetical protein
VTTEQQIIASEINDFGQKLGNFHDESDNRDGADPPLKATGNTPDN